MGLLTAIRPRTLAAVLPAGARAGWQVAGGTIALAGSTATTAATVAGAVSRATFSAAVGEGGRLAGAAVTPLADAAAGRRRRYVWSRAGRAHIEVRGLAGRGASQRRLAGRLTAALRRLDGVDWARVNAVAGHVLIAFDEGAVDTDRLVRAVADVERANGTDDEDFERTLPPHPGDAAPLVLAGATLAADCVGMAVASIGRLSPLPGPHRGIRAPVILAEANPRIRRALESRLGAARADAVLGAASVLVHSATGGASPLAVDAAYRVLLIGEMRERRAVWRRRENDLCPPGWGPYEPRARRARPPPPPAGPVERLADREEVASLLGAAGVLAASRSPGRASDVILATAPKAARYGREGFAATLGRRLAGRGVVPLDPAALRRLDRVSAVVIDARALCSPRPRVLSAVSTSRSEDDARIWQLAERVLRGRTADKLSDPGPWRRGAWRLRPSEDNGPVPIDGPTPRTLELLDERGRRHGRVDVSCEPDPLSEGVLGAALAAADRVEITEHAGFAELTARVHAVIPAARSAAERVRGLQAEGHGVLVLSPDGAALEAADVGIAVLRGDASALSADLVCGPGMAEVVTVLRAAAVARRVSERSARLSLGGAALGALLAVAGGRRRGALLSPVQGTALAALASGAYSARRVAGRPAPRPVPYVSWHALEADEVLARLDDARDEWDPAPEPDRTGLRPLIASAGEIPLVSTVLVGPARGGLTLARAVQGELRDPLTPVLAFGAAASAALGSGTDAALLGGVMGGNAVIGGLQRTRAERALAGLMRGQRPAARRVRRPAAPADLAGLSGSGTETIDAAVLRIGDVILLRPADVVPADARLLLSDGMEVDESSLTGEPVPVVKTPEPTPGADLPEQSCMVYEGGTVVAGGGYAVVVATGAATQAGRAAALVDRSDGDIGVQARLAELARVTVPATGVGGLLVSGLGLLRGVPLRDALTSGVAVAAAAVPEGLPLVATTAAQLAAARRLSRRGVLVRSPQALEALGRVDTVCFDKTGTLTEGWLAVARLASAGGGLPDPRSGGDAGPSARFAARLLRVAARTCPNPDGDATFAARHATDSAVLDAAGALPERDGAWRPRGELPFEASRGYAASVGEDDGTARLAVKGAPEVVLGRCARCVVPPRGRGDPAEAAFTPRRRRAAEELVTALAADGLRVLAVAEATDVSLDEDIGGQVRDLTFVGLLGIADSPRPEARETVRRLGEIGFRVTMITGDHPATAVAIARDLGVPDADRVMTGADLDALSEAELAGRVAETAVFARSSPEQKVRIVRALRGAGRCVAMTGDGSNDAAAIRLADVGIGVTGRGTFPARGAADLVLTDHDTTRVVDAILEGRSLWGSVRDAVSILVGGNAGEVAFTVAGTLLSGRSPLSTRQFLLVNLLTDMLPALAVAVAPADPGGDAAGAPAERLLGTELGRAIAVRGAATTLGATAAWSAGRLTGRRRRAGTMGLAALVLTQLAQTPLTKTHSPLVLVTSGLSAAALFAVVETPGVSRFFGCTPLGPVAWSVVAASAAGSAAFAALAPRIEARLPL